MWKADIAPPDYFKRYGRQVVCTTCGVQQRTRPELHQAGWRLREMPCKTEGCLGRLRTGRWIKQRQVAERAYAAKRRAGKLEHVRGSLQALRRSPRD